MKQILTKIALVALALVANGHPGLSIGQSQINAYIDPMSHRLLTSEEYYPGQVRKALLKLTIPENASPNQVVAELTKNYAAPTIIFASTFLNIADLADEDSKCDSWLIRDAAVVYALSKTPELQHFTKFMQDVGGNKMAQCAQILEAEFTESPKDEYENTFDDFYRKAFGLRQEANDAQLLQKLTNFNIVTDMFDLSAAFPVAKKFNSEHQREISEKWLNVSKFVEFLCRAERDSKLVLKAANLATACGTYELKNERLQKLNEYHRVCLAQIAGLEASKKHFKKLETHSKSLLKKVRAFGTRRW